MTETREKSAPARGVPWYWRLHLVVLALVGVPMLMMLLVYSFLSGSLPSIGAFLCAAFLSTGLAGYAMRNI